MSFGCGDKFHGLRRSFVICVEHGWGGLMSSAVSRLPEFVVCSDRVFHGLGLGISSSDVVSLLLRVQRIEREKHVSSRGSKCRDALDLAAAWTDLGDSWAPDRQVKFTQHLTARAHNLWLKTFCVPQKSFVIGHVFTEHPFNPFPPFFSSPTTSLTPPTTSPGPLTGIRLNPCAASLGDGLPGHLAGPIPNTRYEPKFCIDVSSEHKPTNLPTSNIGFPLECDATVAPSEDLHLPQHSGASSSKPAYGSKQSSPIVETWFIRDQPHESGSR